MFPVEKESGIQKKSISYRKLLLGIIIALVGVRLLWSLTIIRQTSISVIAPTREIPLPRLTAPNAIKPETIAQVHLLEHWAKGRFHSMAWSPDGRYFAIATTPGVNLYDGQTFQLLRYVSLPLRNIDKLVFSPDDASLAVAAEKGNILLIDLTDDKILRQWKLDDSVLTLTYLKDGTLICVTDMGVIGNARRLLKLVNDSWQTVKDLDENLLHNIIFVPERQAFMVFYEDSVRLVDPRSGAEETLPYPVPYTGIFGLTNDVLFILNRDRALLSIYQDGDLLKQIGFTQDVFDLFLSPDGSLLAIESHDPSNNSELARALTFWKLPELELLQTISIPETRSNLHDDILFSPTGDHLAFLVSDSVVKILSTAKGDTHEIVIHDPLAGIADVAITPDKEILALSCSQSTVSIVKIPSAISVQEWHVDEPTCGQFLGDAATIAIGQSDQNLQLYKLGEATSLTKVGFPYCDSCASFSSDGSLGARSYGISSSGDPVIVSIWQRKFGLSQQWKFYDLESDPFKVAVSPSGQYVAGTNHSTTYLWVYGIESGRRYPALVSPIVFSPDEKYLASSTQGILDLETGRLIGLEREEEAWFFDITPAFSPDGQILTAEDHGTMDMYFWQVSNGVLLAKLNDPDSSYKFVFSPDGTFLVGLGEGFVNVWGISETVH